MLTKIVVESFKSLEKVELELGLVNVFVGANGSGKSNLLEAVGVLSAAASGRVDDEALMRRGVRPGSPQLYKCALKGPGQTPHIAFAGEAEHASYRVSLFSPDGTPAWRYYSESLKSGDREIAGRSRPMKSRNPEAGFAALKAADLSDSDPALALLDLLRAYAIYEPNTPTLRGFVPENQPREPLGLSGGGLPQAIHTLLATVRPDNRKAERFEMFSELIDWAASIDSAPPQVFSLSPYTSSTGAVKFIDRFMKPDLNEISGADASEGALYVLFAAALTLDDRAPKLFALDNADHGLNPRLAKALIGRICDAVLSAENARQLLLTTHNPQVLDGLRLQDDRVRLFTVSRTNTGRTTVRRIELNEKLLAMAKDGWTLSRLWVMGHLGGVPDV